MRNHVFASREKSLATLSIVPHTLSVERNNTRKKINKKKKQIGIVWNRKFSVAQQFYHNLFTVYANDHNKYIRETCQCRLVRSMVNHIRHQRTNINTDGWRAAACA